MGEGPILLWLLFAAALGLLCGSFANMLVHRLPRGVMLAMGSRSRCPVCGALIRWHDNVPVASFLALRGRCRSCRAPIPVRYLAIELLCGALFALFAWRAWGPAGLGSGLAGVGFLLSLWLTVAAVIDWEHRILPDSLTLPGIVAAPLLAILLPAGPFWPGRGLAPPWGSLLGSGAGIVAGAGILWAVRVLGRAAFHREAMGLGDVKLMAFLGGIVGVEGVLITFFLSCLGGALAGMILVVVRRDHYLPFGPCLAATSLALVLFRSELPAALEEAATLPAQSPIGLAGLLVLAGAGIASLVFLRRLRREAPAAAEDGSVGKGGMS